MRRQILRAIQENKRLDFSDCVLKGAGPVLGERRAAMGPVLATSFGQYPPDERGATAGDAEMPLTTREFEALSLAARCRLLNVPPSDKTDAPVWAASTNKFVEVPAAELLAAIDSAARAGVSEARHGLQIVGAHIIGTLDLVNCRLPFSLRLIGCVIDGPVRINHGELLTLDLSGSAMRGLFANYVSCRSVRLRRTFSTSVIDFGGAKIEGVFDATDAVVLPLNDPPEGEAFVGDRGVFNCSLAQIHNEMRLNRARIYGGLTMKGTIVHRSLFIQGALIRSPLAVVETFAFGLAGYDRPKSAAAGLPPSIRAHGEAEELVAATLHARDDGGECEWRRRRESVVRLARSARALTSWLRDGAAGEPYLAAPKLLRRILAETAEPRMSSLRATGAEVRGSIYARGLRTGGGVRMKYIKVGGSIHFEGARMRSHKGVAAGFERLIAHVDDRLRVWLSHLIKENADALNDQGRDSDAPFAVDLRHAEVGGDVKFGPHRRRHQGSGADAALEQELIAFVAEAGKDDQAALVSQFDDQAAPASQFKEKLDFSVRTLIIGTVSVEGSQIGGELEMRRVVANVFEPRSSIDTHFLNFAHAKIGGDVDVSASIGVQGACGEYASVSGTVRFSGIPKYNQEEQQWGKPKNRSAVLSGKISLVGAKVSGDGIFVFAPNPFHGPSPSLKLQRTAFGGGLYIFPVSGDMSHDAPDRDFVPQQGDDRLPEVDLRNASAAVIAHAPAAWPQGGNLVVEGFDYDRARNLGPLSPTPRKLAKGSDDLLRNAANVFIAMFFVLLLARWLSVESVPLVRDFARWVDFAANTAGATNLWLFVGWGGAVSALSLVRLITSPTRHDAKPRAILWLKLQQARPNEHSVSRLVWPLQPYSQAARVLRAAGRHMSANWVELERLRDRRQFLSWRHNFGVKVVLAAADKITKYGFAPMRTLMIAVFIVIFGAMVFRSADLCAQMTPTSDNLIATAYQRAAGAPADTPAATSTKGHISRAVAEARDSLGKVAGGPSKGGIDWAKYDFLRYPPAAPRALSGEDEWPRYPIKGFGEVAGEPYPKFVSILYALDVFVPIFDLGQEAYWAPALDRLYDELNPPPYCAYTGSLYVGAYVVLRLLGWLFAMVIAVAVVTRAETLVSRNEE